MRSLLSERGGVPHLISTLSIILQASLLISLPRDPLWTKVHRASTPASATLQPWAYERPHFRKRCPLPMFLHSIPCTSLSLCSPFRTMKLSTSKLGVVRHRAVPPRRIERRCGSIGLSHTITYGLAYFQCTRHLALSQRPCLDSTSMSGVPTRQQQRL